jgi:type VI secretion system protein ImpH
MDRLRQKDTALHDFLDLFNHRALSLFYRAWEKHRFAVAFEQGREDRFTEYLFDLIGMGTRGLQGKLGLPDKGLLCYGGLIGQRPHSASAIGAILTDYFGVRARVEQFFGQWLQLEQSDLTKLGRANHRLGVMTIAGARVWDSQSKFRVRIGPLSYQQFIAFLPSGSAFEPIKALTRFLAGMEFDFDYQLLLKADEVPGTMLTTRARRKPMLGWNTWLKTKEMEEDDGQVVLRRC